MGKLPIIALTLGVALGSILVFLTRSGRIDLAGATATPEAPAASICTSSYFGNQCSDRDTSAIMSARGDRAFSGKGYEGQVAFVDVRPGAEFGTAAIVGQRVEAEIVCLTGSARLARTARFELNRGDRAVLSGIIERRSGRTLYLTHCAYWRA